MSDEVLFPGEPCYDLLKQTTRPRLSFDAGNDQAASTLDDLFPIEGVREGFKTVREIFKAQSAPSSCHLVETEEGHEWCANTVWNVINTEAQRLGIK